METNTALGTVIGGLSASSYKQKVNIYVRECDNGFIVSETNVYPLREKIAKDGYEAANIVAEYLDRNNKV